MRFEVKVPSTEEMGSYIAIVDNKYQSAAKEALNDYNNMREYDGLPPVTRMPNGTQYLAVEAGRIDMRKDKSIPVVSVVKQR